MLDVENEISNGGEDNNHVISKCDRTRCITCKGGRLCLDNFVQNHITNELFPLTINGSCRTKNCVYVIKCKEEKCKYQYVGHTINHISSRISQHKSSIIRGGGCKILKEHFTQIHKLEDMSIMPIVKFSEGLTLKDREIIEESWILKLNTIYPYGLNARCKKVGIMDAELNVISSKSTIYSKFDVVKIDRGKRGGSSDKSSTTANFNEDDFISSVLREEVSLHDIRTKLCSLKKKQLKLVYIKSISVINTNLENVLDRHLCFYLKDLTWFYLMRMGISKVNNKQSRNFVIVKYANKFVEYVNFKKIFKERIFFREF